MSKKFCKINSLTSKHLVFEYLNGFPFKLWIQSEIIFIEPKKNDFGMNGKSSYFLCKSKEAVENFALGLRSQLVSMCCLWCFWVDRGTLCQLYWFHIRLKWFEAWICSDRSKSYLSLSTNFKPFDDTIVKWQRDNSFGATFHFPNDTCSVHIEVRVSYQFRYFLTWIFVKITHSFTKKSSIT